MTDRVMVGNCQRYGPVTGVVIENDKIIALTWSDEFQCVVDIHLNSLDIMIMCE